jgi:hypothetical protein
VGLLGAYVEDVVSAPGASGSFAQDIEQLLEQLATPLVMELGNPPPQERYLPNRKQRVGRSPAAHNRALLGNGTQRRRNGR